MKTITFIRDAHRDFLPDDIGNELSASQILQIEAALQFCSQFLSHENGDTRLVPILSENLPRLVDWRETGGASRLRSLLLLLPKMSNQAWRNSLLTYQKLPIEHRCFDILDDGKRFSLLEVGDDARKEFLASIFDTIIDTDPVLVNYLEEERDGLENNSVRVRYFRSGKQLELTYRIPKALYRRASEVNLPEPRPRKMPRERRANITLTKSELVARGELIDAIDREAGRKSLEIGKRCANLDLTGVGKADDQISLKQQPEHIVGKPSAGKSTLVRSIVPELAARGYRIVVLVNSTAQAQIQAEAFCAHGVKATAWCGWRNREEHAMRRYLSQEKRIPIRDGFPDAGNLAGGCLLRACQQGDEAELSQLAASQELPPPGASDGICQALHDPRRPNTTPKACPFHTICPSYAQERATLDADVVVITAQALNSMRPSPFYYPQCSTIMEWITEYIDVVIADEVDGIQQILDDAQSLEQQMYAGEAYGNVMAEMTSKHSRLRADGGGHQQLEACLNASTTLERYVRWGANLIADASTRNLGASVFKYGYNEHTILAATALNLYRNNKALMGSCLGPAYRSISDILELTTVIEREYESRFKNDVEFSFYQQIPPWLEKEHGRFPTLHLAAGWSLARLAHYIQSHLRSVERPELNALEYCAKLWNESSETGSLCGGLELFFPWIEAALTEGEKNAREQQRQQLAKDLQTLLVIAVMTRLAIRTYERLSYPAQQLVAEELAMPAAIGQAARLERLYRASLPSTLIQDSSQFEYRREEGNQHSIMFRRLLAPGRSLLYHLPYLREAEGVSGPHLLVLSGTSYGGRNMRYPEGHPSAKQAYEPSLASPDFDVDIPVSVILEQPKTEREAITERSIFEPLMLENENGKAIRVSGSGAFREKNAVLLAAGLLSPAVGEANSMVEGHFADAQLRWGDEFSGRRRVMLVASSYDMVKKLVQELPAHLPPNRWTLVGVRKDEFKIRDKAGLSDNCYWLSAADVEAFGDFPENSVLIAPLSVISRGHNILCESVALGRKVAAISHIYFLNRPHPHPTDQSALRGLHNRKINALSLCSFERQAKPGENTVQLMSRLRKEAKIRYQKALHQQLPITQMDEESRLRILYRPLVQLWQTICRGVRGGVPVYAGFTDAAFHPQSSTGRKDNTASSLLLGIDELLSRLLDEKWNPDAELAERLFDTPRVAFTKLRGDLVNLAESIKDDCIEENKSPDIELLDDGYEDEDEYVV
ncbi:hypothetical protein [Pseudoalteromonas sp. Of7M-16]|uniref:hypothetical protein n=1 Tax=Pseudoalteromonas sp. Of7M-16 TaxID=2917756 RepID=UPI001EF49E76|nr:hypothetical protein [Pseudoalteromonas sp. Of7M-16]MCG7548797.1 hypothetical protein [Pseudoalteromonas sp. Of7M-16]